MKYLLLFLFSTLFIISGLGQDLSPDDELYIKESRPRFYGEIVKQLQRALEVSGYSVGPDGIDGWFGTDTKKALLRYQKDHKLPTTGKIKVKDIPAIPVWIPEIEPNYYIPLETIENQPIRGTVIVVKQEVPTILTSKYGEFTIDKNELNNYHVTQIEMSPSGRFGFALGYHDNDSTRFIGNCAIIWDIITKKTMYCFGDYAFFNEEYQAMREGYESLKIIRAWWIQDDTFCAEVTALHYEKMETGYFKIYSGQQNYKSI